MSDLVNPYIAGCPVTSTEMFFGREDTFEFICRTLVGRHRDNVIVLYGQQRTGKTSILYQVRSRLGARYLCVLMDLQDFALAGLDGFLWELANHITRVLRREYQITLSRPCREAFGADARSFFEEEFLTQVWAAIGDRHLLLMLDEAIRLEEQVHAGVLEHEIFAYMRHLMQHYEQLNFLFSLGSGLEEMEKEYAFLFNVGLYKQISFLDRHAANQLITQPVKHCYQVEPEAVERIYQITSGHAYYTQLVCHCLFNRWVQQQTPSIGGPEVNEVLNEAVEQGSAVLKHVWDESTPLEKAVLASMVSLTTDNRPVGIDEISKRWRQLNVALPAGNIAQAIKQLIAREVITGTDKYSFTVELQRLWVQKHRRLEWVKEDLREYPPPPPDLHQLLRQPRSRILAVGLLVLLLISSGSLYYAVLVPAHQRLLQAQRATAIASQYPFSANPPLLTDPLKYNNSSDAHWDEHPAGPSDGCKFTAGGYHVYANDIRYSSGCYAKSPKLSNLRDFTYEIEMTIIKGNCGGLVFRYDSSNIKDYRFEICQDSQYFFVREDATHSNTTENSFSSSIKQGRNQSNWVAVKAQGQSITLYVNRQRIDQITDNTYRSGRIGLIADPSTQNSYPTEVAYNNAKVWLL